MTKSSKNSSDSSEIVAGDPALPRHVAVIMDGNGRWAKARHLPRVEGHRQGARTVREIVEESRRLGIRYLTLFAFSTENWQRPEDEVSALMKLFLRFLESELETLLKNGIRLRAIGDLNRLPEAVRALLDRSQENTKQMQGMDLILAVSYGAREEIVHATRKISEAVLAGQIKPSEINEALIAKNLYAPEVPDPDLLIRTSNESRISNFLLWQLAYAEIVVTSALWPEFSVADYHNCLNEYRRRDRRFGLTSEQIAQAGLRDVLR